MSNDAIKFTDLEYDDFNLIITNESILKPHNLARSLFEKDSEFLKKLNFVIGLSRLFSVESDTSWGYQIRDATISRGGKRIKHIRTRKVLRKNKHKRRRFTQLNRGYKRGANSIIRRYK